MRFVAFEGAIIFIRVAISSLMNERREMKRRAADWMVITTGLVISLGHCLPVFGFKDIFFRGVSANTLMAPRDVNYNGFFKAHILPSYL